MSVPVLMYHSVSRHADPRFSRWVVTPEQLESHLAALTEAGYETVAASEVVEAVSGGRSLADRVAALTFDDGFADFRSVAFPILRGFSVRCTLFPATAYLGGTSRWLRREGEGGRAMLTPRDLVWLAEREIEMGAHGHSHAMLDLLPVDVMTRDVATSREIVERCIDSPIDTFAYPHGHADGPTRRAVADLGFRGAFGVADAVTPISGDPFYLTRLIVDDATSAENLLDRLTLGQVVGPSHRRARAAAGRMWRRRLRHNQTRLATHEAGLR